MLYELDIPAFPSGISTRFLLSWNFEHEKMTSRDLGVLAIFFLFAKFSRSYIFVSASPWVLPRISVAA